MPSIQDLIDAANRRSEEPFDMDAYLQGLDPAIQASAARQREGLPDPSAPPAGTPAGDGTVPPAPVGPDATAGTVPPAAAIPPPPAAPPAPPAPDTVRIGDEELSLAEAQALLTLHRSITSPSAAPTFPVAPEAASPSSSAAPPAEAPLPTFIDPDNEGQVQMYRRLEALETSVTTRQQAEAQATAQNAMLGAATRAGNAFAARHPELDQTDLTNLAHVVGSSPLARALGALGDPAAAETGFVDLMESTLWQHEAFRSKVLAPTTPPPTAPAGNGQMTPDERRQALTGLSAASGLPTAPPVPPSGVSTRPDGRMDESSRARIVAEMADRMRSAQGGGF